MPSARSSEPSEPMLPSLTQETERWWTVDGAICISFVHLANGWRFWPVIDVEIGDFSTLTEAVAACRIEIARAPTFYATERRRRLAKGHRVGPEVSL